METKSKLNKSLQITLEKGFSKYYMDPHDFAYKTARRIESNMNNYAEHSIDYVAPYTSLVTSSMMGKSRLMKELANHLPSVYICLRNTDSSGYPAATPEITDWLNKGVVETMGLSLYDIYDPLHLLPSLKFSVFLLSLIEQVAVLAGDLDTLAELDLVPTKLTLPSQEGDSSPKANFSWMWKFFAEHHRNSTKLAEFWKEVIAKANSRMKGIEDPETAEEYLTGQFRADLQVAYSQLTNAFLESGVSKEKFMLLLCVDEARSLCARSAVDGKPIRGDSRFRGDVDENPDEDSIWEPFSNFRALRRALKFLEQAAGQPVVPGFGVMFPIPRIFGLFTDTTSRLANFQPRTLEDVSLRLVPLPTPGSTQFQPLHTFSSIDVHSIVCNEDKCLSDITKVANAERLIKFGRAGWYSVYSGETNLGKRHYDYSTIVNLAICKLLCVDQPDRALHELNDNTKKMNPKSLLRLLALLAPRLALSAGPFTPEAKEMISSHLAILIRTDDDRHFVRTAYPSEPIVAQASASIISKIGMGLLEQQATAESYYPKSFVLWQSIRHKTNLRKMQWSFAQPIKVSHFLDHLFSAPSGKTSFTAVLDAKTLNVDENELQRFLNGYVFFNHFIRVEVQLSVDLLVKLWNRGAAIQPVDNCEAFDHVIPVVLAQADGTLSSFGPLYGKWSDAEKQEACKCVSFILINSRNYKNAYGKELSAAAIQPTQNNFADYSKFIGSGDSVFTGNDDSPKSVYLSILQGFGPRLVREKEHVKIVTYPRSSPRHPTRRQIVIILEELGGETYRCLQDDVIDKPLMDDDVEVKDADVESANEKTNDEVKYGKQKDVRKYLEMLKQEKSLFLDGLKDNDPEHIGITENLPGVLRTEDQEEKWRAKWKAVKDNMNKTDLCR